MYKSWRFEEISQRRTWSFAVSKMKPRELGKWVQSVSGLSFWVLVTTTHVKVWDGWCITTVLGAGGCIRQQRTPRTHWPASFQVPDSVSKKGGEELSKTSSANLQPLHVLTHMVHTPTDVYIEHMYTHTTTIWPHIGGGVRTQTLREGNTDWSILCVIASRFRIHPLSPPFLYCYRTALINWSFPLCVSLLPPFALPLSKLITATVSINSERNLPFVVEKRRKSSH